MMNTKITTVFENDQTIIRKHEVQGEGIAWSIEGAYTNELVTFLKESGTYCLSILHGDNWEFSFLKDCHEKIKEISLSDNIARYKLDGIECLANLEELGLDVKSSSALSFSMFEKLKVAGVVWQKNYSDDLFQCPNLRELFLNGYKGHNIKPIAKAKSLIKLDMSSCALESLIGIGEISDLKYLTIYNLRMLHSLDGLEECKALEKLDISASNNITDFSVLAGIDSLKKLNIKLKQISTLSFLENHPSLEEVFLYETKILDGDVSVFKTIPNIKKVHFANKRGYSQKVEELRRELGIQEH